MEERIINIYERHLLLLAFFNSFVYQISNGTIFDKNNEKPLIVVNLENFSYVILIQ